MYMSLFSFSKSAERIGAIVDVGSGSVLVAVVASKKDAPSPTIIWSHREHAPLRNIDSLDQSAKAVMTALVNALLKFDVEGRRALYEYNKRSRVDEIQCSIAAPWSYTVTKTINYTQEEAFEVTDSLIEELLRTATGKIEVELSENESASQLGLSIIARTTMDLLANGYRVKRPKGEKTKELSISHASVVTQQYLIDHIEDLRHKLFPSTDMHTLSYVLILHCVVRDIFKNAFDSCLVNITYEATEIGIVRDGTLQYATHTPFGSFSLAREIADITSVPLLEAFQSLHNETPYAFMQNLPESQKAEVEKVIEAYTARVADLFHETGDDLSIPKQIFLHADLKSEPLFRDIIEKAAKRRLKSEPNIRLITTALIQNLGLEGSQALAGDTAMLPSVQFFHKQGHCNDFEYL
jgi:cell division ATPase FtsA